MVNWAMRTRRNVHATTLNLGGRIVCYEYAEIVMVKRRRPRLIASGRFLSASIEENV